MKLSDGQESQRTQLRDRKCIKTGREMENRAT